MKITTSAPKGHEYDVRTAVRKLEVTAAHPTDYWRLAIVYQALLRGMLDPSLVKISKTLKIPVPGESAAKDDEGGGE